MGQSLSNLCGLKPAEPKQWPQFEAKMKSEVRPCRAATSWLHPHLATHPYLSTPSPQGLSDAAIAAFKHNFVTLASGANLMISEEPPPVKLGGWPAPRLAERPPAARAPTPLAASAAASQTERPGRRMPAARAPTPLSGSARLWPPRLSVLAQQCVCRVFVVHAPTRARLGWACLGPARLCSPQAVYVPTAHSRFEEELQKQHVLTAYLLPTY